MGLVVLAANDSNLMRFAANPANPIKLGSSNYRLFIIYSIVFKGERRRVNVLLSI